MNTSESNYWKDKWSNRPSEPAISFAKRACKLIRTENLEAPLDLGCCDSRDSICFFDKGLQVTAIDFSKSGIRELKARQKIDCVLRDIRNINFAENSLDAIYAHLTLHCLDDKTTSKILNNLYEILKRAGLIPVKCKSTDDALPGKGEKVGDNMYEK